MSKFEEPYWTPLQLLAWVYLRDQELVSSFGSGDHADRWHEEEHILFPDRTKTLAKVPARVPSRLRLDLKAAERGAAPLGAREAAEDDILLRILRAELMVTGTQNGAGARHEIPADHFCDLEIEWDDSKAVQKSRFRQGDVWTELRFRRDDILSIWGDPWLSEAPPSAPSADAPGETTATLGDVVKDGAASRRSEASEAPDNIAETELAVPGLRSNEVAEPLLAAASNSASDQGTPAHTPRKQRTLNKQKMYEIWGDIAKEHGLNTDGTARTPTQIAKKVAQDPRAKDPVSEKCPAYSSVIRRLNEFHAGWAEKN